jgi:membrane protein
MTFPSRLDWSEIRESKTQGSEASRDVDRSLWLLLKTLPRVLRQAAIEWSHDNAPHRHRVYALLSFAPVIVIAIALAVAAQDATEGRLASEIRGVAGPEAARTFRDIIKGAYQPQTGMIATLFGLVALVFGASSVFVELRDAMNTRAVNLLTRSG